MPKSKPKPAPAKGLVATTGLDYLGTDGKDHRVEAGESVDAADINPQALDWMTSAGFLAPVEAEAD